MSKKYGTDLLGKAIFVSPKSRDRIENSQNIKFYMGLLENENLQKTINKRYKIRTLNNQVERGLKRVESELNARKIRLKNLFEVETAALCRDLEKLQSSNQIKIEEPYKEESVSKTINDENRNNLQYKFMNTAKYDEVNKLIIKQKGLETQRVHELQMQEKRSKMLQEKQMENVWHEIMITDVQNKRLEEALELKKNKERVTMMKTYLTEQVKQADELKKIEYIKEKEKEIQQTIEINKNLEIDLSEDKTRQCKKKKLLREELLKQIKIHEEIRQKHRMEELQMDETFHKTATEDCHEKEQRIILERELQRREVDLFNEHLTSLKSYRDECERNYDKALLKITLNKLMENEKQIKLLHMKRRELLRDAITERDNQIKEKKKRAEDRNINDKAELRNRIEYEKHLKEIEKSEKSIDIERKTTYRKCLDDQMSAIKLSKEKEVENMKITYEANVVEERELNEKCLEIMKKEINVKNLHPFTKAIVKHN